MSISEAGGPGAEVLVWALLELEAWLRKSTGCRGYEEGGSENGLCRVLRGTKPPRDEAPVGEREVEAEADVSEGGESESRLARPLDWKG